MKNIIITIGLVLLVVACKEVKEETPKTQTVDVSYISFGEKITDENSIPKEAMYQKFKALKKGDTIDVKFASNINEVCKAKGCWMKLDLGDNKDSMVKFKDYDFFMPLNSDHKDVIVEGRAFVSEISVDELRHYAKDAGKSKEEIEKIIEPEFSYAFEADGVLMVE